MEVFFLERGGTVSERGGFPPRPPPLGAPMFMILVIIIVDFNKKVRAAKFFFTKLPQNRGKSARRGTNFERGGTKGGGINFERGGTKNKKRGGNGGFFFGKGGDSK